MIPMIDNNVPLKSYCGAELIFILMLNPSLTITVILAQLRRSAGRISKTLTYKIIYVDDNPEVTDLPAGVTVVELPREGGGIASRAGKVFLITALF